MKYGGGEKKYCGGGGKGEEEKEARENVLRMTLRRMYRKVKNVVPEGQKCVP
jgi:hypothetical protein